MPCALVLSAGGMFAAYQAGAWKVLAPILKPDLIVGASAGALNGWGIATGRTPAALIEEWTNPETADLMRTRFPALTLFDPAPLIRHIQRTFGSGPPSIPYSLTMVEVPRLRRVRISGERVTPAHLLASCAIPFGYPPVRIDGRLYVDGGLLDVVPLWAAAEMGATRAVVVNALPLMPSAIVRFGVSLVRAVGPAATVYPNLEVVLVRAKGPLGSVSDAIRWKESNIRRWIGQGEEDAARAVKLMKG